jgi:hypothetical protein
MILTVLILPTLASIYWFWVRPILRLRPSLKDFYARSDSFLEAVRLKFAGIKQKLASAAVVAASIAVTMYDVLAPIVSQVDVGGLTGSVPGWAWPLVMIAITALFQWLRNLADRRRGEAEQEAKE